MKTFLIIYIVSFALTVPLFDLIYYLYDFSEVKYATKDTIVIVAIIPITNSIACISLIFLVFQEIKKLFIVNIMFWYFKKQKKSKYLDNE